MSASFFDTSSENLPENDSARVTLRGILNRSQLTLSEALNTEALVGDLVALQARTA